MFSRQKKNIIKKHYNILPIRYDYLLPFIYKQMFISNIIYKLQTIIYKPKIIYKGYNSPYKQGLVTCSTTINIGSIEPLYTIPSHPQHSSNKPVPPFLCRSLELYLSIYLLYSPYSYSYLSLRVICFVGPPSYQGYHSKPTCEVRDLTQPRPP